MISPVTTKRSRVSPADKRDRVKKRPCSESATRFLRIMQEWRADPTLYCSVVAGDIAWLLQEWSDIGDALSFDYAPDVSVYTLPPHTHEYAKCSLSQDGSRLVVMLIEYAIHEIYLVSYSLRNGKYALLWSRRIAPFSYTAVTPAIENSGLVYLLDTASKTILEYVDGESAPRLCTEQTTILDRLPLFNPRRILGESNLLNLEGECYGCNFRKGTLFRQKSYSAPLDEIKFTTKECVRTIDKSSSSPQGPNPNVAFVCTDASSNVVLFKDPLNGDAAKTIEFYIYDKDFNFKMLCRVKKIRPFSRLLCASIDRFGHITLLTSASFAQSTPHCDVFCSKNPPKVSWTVVELKKI